MRLENQLQKVINLLIEVLSTFMEANDTIAQIRTADEREIINDGYSNAIIKLKDLRRGEASGISSSQRSKAERLQLDKMFNMKMEQKKPAYVKNVKKLETKAALEQKYQMELEKLEREIETENVQQLILQLRELVTWAQTLTEQQSDRNWEKLAESNDNSKVAMCHSRKKVKELKTIPGDKLGEFLCSFLKIYFLIRLVQDLYRL